MRSDCFDRVLDMRSQYKKAYIQYQAKLLRSVARIGKLQVELRQEQANDADRYLEARLRRLLLGCDSVIT